MTEWTIVSQLGRALREFASYALVSGVAFAVDTLIYAVFFVAYRPKYTFLFGNTLLVVLFGLQLAACLAYYCLRPGVTDAWLRLGLGGVCTGLLLLYGLHATVITIVERSVSINVLRFLSDGTSQPYDTIESNFVDTFVKRDKAVCKRLDEQMRLGSVVHRDGRYAITPKGLRTFKILEATNLITGDKHPQNAVSCSEGAVTPRTDDSVRAFDSGSPPASGANSQPADGDAESSAARFRSPS
jgi:hypothetical protein